MNRSKRRQTARKRAENYPLDPVALQRCKENYPCLYIAREMDRDGHERQIERRATSQAAIEDAKDKHLEHGRPTWVIDVISGVTFWRSGQQKSAAGGGR